jgi:hypothetical protein
LGSGDADGLQTTMSDNAEEAMEVTMYDQSRSKIVATSTMGEGLFLIRRADGLGQVANTNRGRLLPPGPMDSFMVRGDWEPCDDADLAQVLASIGPLARLKRLGSMIVWAVFDGRFEPDDQRRIPFGRAMSFAWADVNILGDLGVRKSACGCERRFGRPLILCWPHAGLDD